MTLKVSVSGQSTFKAFIESLEFSLINPSSMQWQDRRIVKAEIEALDIKREVLLNNFIYIRINFSYDGYNPDSA